MISEDDVVINTDDIDLGHGDHLLREHGHLPPGRGGHLQHPRPHGAQPGRARGECRQQVSCDWSPQCSPLIGPQRARPGVHHLPRGGAQDDGGQRLGGHLLLHACGRLFEVVNV